MTLVIKVRDVAIVSTSVGSDEGSIVVRFRPSWFGYQLDVAIESGKQTSAFSVSA